MHRHTEHLREPLDSPLRGDSRALHHLGVRVSESQSTEIPRSLPLAGFRNLKIIIKKPTRPLKSQWKPGPAPLPKDSTGWPAPSPASPQSVSNPFDLALPGWCTSRVEETLLLQLWLFSPPPLPASLPLPLHPSRAGRPGGRGHPSILIHSHCRSGRDVAFRREARPSASTPTSQRAADPGWSGGIQAPQVRPEVQEGGAAWSGAWPRSPSPTPPCRLAPRL